MKSLCAPFLAGLLCLATSVAFGQVQVQARLDPAAATTRDVVQLAVEVSGPGSFGVVDVAVAPIEGLRIERVPSVATSFSIINGRQTSLRRYTFHITPLAEGSYTLDGITATVDGHVHQAAPVVLRITAAPQIPSGTSFIPVPADTHLPAHFLRATLEPQRAYIDQPVKLTIEFFTTATRDDRLSFDSSELSSAMFSGLGFACYEHDHATGPRRSYTYTQETLGGQAYLRIPIKTFFLFPVTAGKHRLPPAQVTVEMLDRTQRVRDFFGGLSYGTRQMRLRSDPLELEVVGLPEAGRPKSFDGAVGQYRMEAALDKTEVRVGEPVTLTLTIAGRGRIDNVNTPEFGDLPDFRRFDVTSDKQRPRVDADGVAAAITFSYVLIPRSANATRVPSLEWSYFDPAQDRYETLATPVFELSVQAGPEGGAAAGPAPALPGRVSFGYEDVNFRHIVYDLNALGGAPALLWTRPGFWGAQAIPLLLFLGSWFWRWRRRRRLADPAGYRRRRAGRAAQAQLARLATAEGDGRFYAGLSSCLLGYLSARFNLEARGLTYPQLARRLCEAGSSQAAAEELVSTLARWDRLRYGGGQDGAAREEELTAARALIAELERAR